MIVTMLQSLKVGMGIAFQSINSARRDSEARRRRTADLFAMRGGSAALQPLPCNRPSTAGLGQAVIGVVWAIT
ncbi:hypothetical protein ACWTU6_04070 [Mesorhizobium sp. BHbsci]